MTKETKADPPRTSGEDQSRVTAETVVTKGPEGLERTKALVQRLVREKKRE